MLGARITVAAFREKETPQIERIIVNLEKMLDGCRGNDSRYKHITEADKMAMRTSIEDGFRVLDERKFENAI